MYIYITALKVSRNKEEGKGEEFEKTENDTHVQEGEREKRSSQSVSCFNEIVVV